jgi:succinoglycan biosynthesis protein ExoM
VSHPSMPTVDVCVATYRRPDGLKNLLASLSAVSTPPLRIIVIDNDARGSSADVVELFARKGLQIQYDVESRKGISAARNLAMSHVRADHFCFLDDDERVSVDWLRHLLSTCEEFKADAVFGPVIKVLPKDSPNWLAGHPVFRTVRRRTGTLLEYGSTGNCLIRTAALGTPRQCFDPAYGLTGGGDTDFFVRLRCRGKRLVWCDEALVFEQVPESRVSARWVRRRSYRLGQSYYRAVVKRLSIRRKADWFARQVAKFMLASAGAFAVWFVSRRLRENLLGMALMSAGQISAWLGVRPFEEYATQQPARGHSP